jgi:hypothetical protein
MSPEPKRYPNPLIDMSPSGLPGFYVVLVVTFGFVSLFVSRDVADVLLLVVVGLAVLATGVSIFFAVRNHGS